MRHFRIPSRGRYMTSMGPRGSNSTSSGGVNPGNTMTHSTFSPVSLVAGAEVVGGGNEEGQTWKCGSWYHYDTST